MTRKKMSKEIEKHMRLMRAAALSVLSKNVVWLHGDDGDDADVVLSLAAIRALERAAEFDPEKSKLSTWLFLLTKHVALNWVRSNHVQTSRFVARIDEHMSDEEAPSIRRTVWLDRHVHSERFVCEDDRTRRMRDVLSRVIDKVPTRYTRNVLRLRLLDGLSVAETAKRLGISERSVTTLFWLGRKEVVATLERLRKTDSIPVENFTDDWYNAA